MGEYIRTRVLNCSRLRYYQRKNGYLNQSVGSTIEEGKFNIDKHSDFAN